MLQSPSSRCSSEEGGQTIINSARLPLVAVGVMRRSSRERFSHLEDVAQRHGSVGEAMDKQRLQQPLHVVERVTHTGQTGKSTDRACQ